MILPVWLGDGPAFPDPETAHPRGLLALGGDLGSGRLLAAYRAGIFPWFGPDDPIMWWSPDPRAVLFPREFHLARRLLRRLRAAEFQIRLDSAFSDVIRICAEIPRAGESGTWIVPGMIAAYTDLHKKGHAHSIELWRRPGPEENSPGISQAREECPRALPPVRDSGGFALVGACYGVEVYPVFCGESMFSLERDASKIALAALVHLALNAGIRAVECQFLTPHLASLGAREISRRGYLDLLASGIAENDASGKNKPDWRARQALFDDRKWPERLAQSLRSPSPP